MRNLERQSSQWTTHLRGLWCFPNSGTLEKHRAQWSSRIWGLWCFSKNCTVERQNPQWPPQTQVEWCFPKTYNVQRQSPQLTSLTQGLWCLPSNNTLQRYRPQWPSPTRGLWCFPKTCNSQRHLSQWRSLTQGYWCFPKHCTQERQSPQWPWQTQGLPPSPPDGSLERLQPEFPWDLMGCWLGGSPPDRSPLFHLPRHFGNRWQSLPLRHVTTPQNPMSDHHLPAIHRPRPLLWGFCDQWDLHNPSVHKALPSILSWCWLAWLQRRFHRLLRSSLSVSRSWRKVGFPTKMHHCYDTIWRFSKFETPTTEDAKKIGRSLHTTRLRKTGIKSWKTSPLSESFGLFVWPEPQELKKQRPQATFETSKLSLWSSWMARQSLTFYIWPSIRVKSLKCTLHTSPTDFKIHVVQFMRVTESLKVFPRCNGFYTLPRNLHEARWWNFVKSRRGCIMPRFPHDDGTTWSCSQRNFNPITTCFQTKWPQKWRNEFERKDLSHGPDPQTSWHCKI